MEGRCTWCGQDPLYVDYHDTEWGVPEYDSQRLWEKLILDGFQAGLAWITILRKRDNFRRAFEGFEPHVIATWGEAEVRRLVNDAGIVRHRGKIEATITNARAWQKIEANEGFDKFLWRYVEDKPIQNAFTSMDQVPAETLLSKTVSKDLKSAGFKFCGTTIVYAFMQATGLVNDHMVGCPRHAQVAALAR